ncbi:MAG: hypothetical protein JWO06_3661 [Bacteroidota bacterium]|nr:hypothetical protein [Bacteroidota bacterium]
MNRNRYYFNVLIVFALALNSCSNPSSAPPQQNPLVFRFEIDSAGNIKNEDVKQKLADFAKDLSHKADRVMLSAYSEQTASKAKNEQVAFDMADAAKKYMSKYDERAYFNIGVEIRGYENPVNPTNPADIQNRRIEFSYMK